MSDRVRGYKANQIICDDWFNMPKEVFEEIFEGFCVSGAGGRDAVDLKSTTKIQREFESHLTHSENSMITGIDGTVATIYLGEGTVGIANFSSIDTKGVLFSTFREPRKIGDIDKVDAPYRCEGGEVVIFCSKKESALVLLEQVQKLVDSFDY